MRAVWPVALVEATMSEWKTIRRTLERLSMFGILDECTCDEPMLNWNGDACAHCQLEAALEALGRLERAHGVRQVDPDCWALRSDKRRAIVVFVDGYWREHGYGPSMREISQAVGLSYGSSLTHHLDVLEREGLIERTPRLNRTIRVAAGVVRSGLG